MVAVSGSSSPSAHKPGRVLASWLSKFSGLSVIEPAPVTVDQLCLAHDRKYVEDILACRIRNGFSNRSEEVAHSLPYTTGSMLSAAREAIHNGKVAVAPCSGFHHAGWNRAEGYCTFNGLMVTSMVLKAEGIVNRGYY
jgi:acetoin utilization deacetylase AcuC-like enzyme